MKMIQDNNEKSTSGSELIHFSEGTALSSAPDEAHSKISPFSVQFHHGIGSVTLIISHCVKGYFEGLYGNHANRQKKLTKARLIFLLLTLSYGTPVLSEVAVNDIYVPVAEALGGQSGLEIGQDGKVQFFNEKPYAVTAEVIKTNGEVVSITLPPRATGPIETAVGIIDKPITTINSYITGGFGKSTVPVEAFSPNEIQSITYVGGRDEAQLVNLAFLATSLIQVASKSLSTSATDQGIFDVINKKVMEKITSPEVSSEILIQMSNGCGFLTTCRSYIESLIKDVTVDVIQEVSVDAAYQSLFDTSGINPSEFAERTLPGVSQLNLLASAENFGDMAALISGTIAFANDPTTLRVQTVTVSGADALSNNDVGIPVTESFDWEADLCRGRDCSNIWDTSFLEQDDEESLEEDNSSTDTPVEETTVHIGLVVTTDDEGDTVLGNNAGTTITIPEEIVQPDEPTDPVDPGPTPEEIAAQIADLRATRNTLSITQQDAAARLQERRNRLTVLQFNELEAVQNASATVNTRIAELRAEQTATGLSAADQQLLLDLVRYEDTLQTEQERIASEITNTQAAITTYESALDQANSDLGANAASLSDLGDDLSDYTAPTFVPEGLTDWSTYEYELPPFMPTEVPSTTTQVGFITAANATPTSTFLLTHGATATITDDGSAATTLSSTNGSLMVTANNPAITTYEHLSWGTFSGPVSFTDNDTGETHSLENVRWMHGVATPASHFANRTGTASWAGFVYGDYALRGTDQTFYNAVNGDVSFTVDFSDNSVSGSLSTNTNYSLDSSTSVSSASFFNLSGSFITGSINGVSGAGINTSILSFGNDSVGELGGAFFGPNAEEFGGTFWYNDDNGGASGIVVAQEGTAPPPVTPDFSNYRGLAAYVAFEPAGSSSPVTSDFVTLAEIDSSSTVRFENTTSPPDNVTPSIGSDGFQYSYTSWGSWTAGTSFVIDGISGRDTAANWIVYDPSTNLRTTGQATYSGDAVGLTSSKSELSGSIQLTADFGNDTVTGNMSLHSSNGQSWADASFDTTIRRDTDSSGFQGALTGSGVSTGVIFGGFAGPNAEELGGGWQIENSNGSSGIGIFRAHQ